MSTYTSSRLGNQVATANQESLAKNAIDPSMSVDKLKEMIQKFKESEEMFKREYNDTFTITSARDLDAVIKRHEEGVTKAQTQLEKVKFCRDFFVSLPFKHGDTAFHKEFGNVLIKAVILTEDDLSQSKYIVISTDGQHKVGTGDLVPITEATKALFGKNK